MEKEIIGIGADQNVIFNRLRLYIDCFLLRNKGDRKQLTDYVSEQISLYAKVCGQDIHPIRVQRRLSADDLEMKFCANNSMTNLSSKHSKSSQNDNNGLDAAVANEVKVKDQVMKCRVSPDEAARPIAAKKSTKRSGDRRSLTKQESLLKPKNERISVPKDEQTQNAASPPQQEAINLSRLKLKEALCKAMDKKYEAKDASIKAKSASPELQRCDVIAPKPIAALSSSQSSTSSSSEDIHDAVGTSFEAGDSNEVDQETFMRVFGLCTHSYSQYLSRRHTKRKRNCTSAARGEYHYGRLDLFEKQYANKRNKRQFLYSPPATRAKKQRRAASDAEAHQNPTATSNAASNTGTVRAPKPNIPAMPSGPISSKVCVTCFKRSKYLPQYDHRRTDQLIIRIFASADNLLGCKLCQGKYHASCHTQLVHASSRDNICPYCWRQKNRQYQLQRIQRKHQRAAYQISVK